MIEPVDRLNNAPRILAWGIDLGGWADSVRRPGTTFEDAVRELYATYAGSPGKVRYGDKTPLYVEYLPELRLTFRRGAVRPPGTGRS